MNRLNQRLLPILGLAGLLSLSLTAAADSQLERFEEISERGSEITMELMVRQYASMGADADAIRAAIPDGEWDDEYREAGQCVLDRYQNIIGKSGIDDMLDRMETMFDQVDQESATFESLEALGDMNTIEGISTEEQIAITTDCRLIEINMRRMSESGFWDAVQSQTATMQDPDDS